MKNLKKAMNSRYILMAIFLAILILPAVGQKCDLMEAYKKEKLFLEPMVVITPDSVPEPHYLLSPFSIADDFKGNIFVSDYKDNNIKVFDYSGKLVRVIGRKGAGPGDLNFPFHLSLAGEKLVVWDLRNRRLCLFSKEGAFIKSEKCISNEFPEKIRGLSSGEIIIELEKIDFEKEKPQICSIKKYSNQLELESELYSHPVWKNKYAKLKNYMTNIIQPFSPLVSWDISTSGKLIVGFSQDYTIEIHDLIAKKTSKFTHSYQPLKVTEEDKEFFFKGMTYSMAGKTIQGAPKEVIELTDFPGFKPAFSTIIVDSQDNILVFPTTPLNQEQTVFDVFDKNGKFVVQVKLLPKVSPTLLFPGKDGTFWSIKNDEDDEPTINRFQVVDKL